MTKLDILKNNYEQIKQGTYKAPTTNYKNQQLRVNNYGNVYIVESNKSYSLKKLQRQMEARR